MKIKISSAHNISGILCPALLLAAAISTSCAAQKNHIGQTAGVDNTSMGPYRALSRLTYLEYKKGNYAMAGSLARVMQVAWKREQGIAILPQSLAKMNSELYEQVDDAMSDFVGPIVERVEPEKKSHKAASKELEQEEKPLTAAFLDATYKKLQEELNVADYGTKTAPPLPKAIHLSPDVLATFAGTYQRPAPAEIPDWHMPPIVIIASQKWLVFAVGSAGSKEEQRYLPLSDTVFFNEEDPNVRLTFNKDENGHITGYTTVSKLKRNILKYSKVLP